MNKFGVLCTLVFALSVSNDLFAQIRGNRGGVERGGGGGSSRLESRPERPARPSVERPTRTERVERRSEPSYERPTPTRTQRSETSYERPTTTRTERTESRYDRPTPGQRPTRTQREDHSGSGRTEPGTIRNTESPSDRTPRSPRYTPRERRTDTIGARTNPRIPHPPRFNPSPRAPHYPRVGPRYNVTHKPHIPPYTVIRYPLPRDYYLRAFRRHVYLSWLFEPVRYGYYDGFWMIDNYPYYVNRGYRYRYNPVEMCQYQLIDGQDYSVVKTFPLQACTTAYDTCAIERDTANANIGLDRYLCAEKVDDDIRNPSTTDYSSSPTDISDEQQTAIDAYLEDKSLLDIFNDGYNYGINNCVVVGLTGNEDDCDYIVKVGNDEEWYPLVDGSICSDNSVAANMGCAIGSEEENTGCILQRAIQEGYCH